MSDGLQVELVGVDKLINNLDRFAEQIGKGMGDAGKKIGSLIIRQPGLRSYPPEGIQNGPGRMTLEGKGTPYVRMVPMGWYERGYGWVSANGDRGRRTSQRLGTKWTVEPSPFQVVIGNTADYAPYVHGEEQSRRMAGYGWRKLVDVAREQLSEAARIYQVFVDRLIKQLGL